MVNPLVMRVRSPFKYLAVMLAMLGISINAVAAIDLTSVSSGWSTLLQGPTFDAGNDQQATAAIDVLGDADHPMFYMEFDDQGTASGADDEVAFRFRGDQVVNKKGFFTGYLWIGLDFDDDAAIDNFMVLDGDGSGSATVTVYDSTDGFNTSPSTTALDSSSGVPVTTGFSFFRELASDVPDIDGDGDPDYIVSYKVNFDALAVALNTTNLTGSGNTVSLSTLNGGDGVTRTTPFSLIASSAQQVNSLNGDLGGYGPDDSTNVSYADQGATSTAITFSNPDPADPTLTIISAAPANVIADGVSTSIITVQAIDSLGNNNTKSAGTVTLSAPGSAVISAVVDNNDGTYTATVTNTVAEGVTITGTINGSAISDTATVTFTAKTGELSLAPIADDTIDENVSYTGPTPQLNGNPAGAVGYSLSGADAALFTIDSSTGVVRLTAKDYENPLDSNGDNVYEVSIIATDGDGNTASVAWMVTVNDVLETASFIIEAIADASVNENTGYTGPAPSIGGSPVGTVSYSLGGTDAGLFTIDPASGVVSMIARDYEAPADANGDNTYELSITAGDEDGNTSGQAWTVTVNDVVETATFTIDAIADASVNENTAYTGPTASISGSPIGSVSYSLGGIDAALFTINSSTGVVSLSGQDYETPADANGDNSYEVSITAADEDGNSDSENWLVTVTDAIEGVADEDNDGIPNSTECPSGPPFDASCIDSDGDNIPDYLDVDADNDGITDAIEGTYDSDIDGIADYLDLDSDNDGLYDLTESGISNPSSLDIDEDGRIDSGFGSNGLADAVEEPADSGSLNYTVADNDGDTFEGFRDRDSDNDGLYDIAEANGSDDDNDGVIGVGVPSVDSNGLVSGAGLSPVDSDSDGVADQRDLDSDNDGIYDVIEAGGEDGNGDGIIGNSTPVVVDGVGVPAGGGLTMRDTDGDGVEDQRDRDGDNDGIPDVIEAGGSDDDGDGVIGSGAPTVDDSGVVTGGGLVPVDTDGDGTDDQLDLDADNDGLNDIVEGGGIDSDGDGTVDGFVDSNNDGYDDNLASTALTRPDSDGDGIPDFKDDDDRDNDGVPDSVDMDDDNDGIPDYLEGDGAVDTDNDGVPDSLDLDSDNDGIFDLVESGLTDTASLDSDADGRIDDSYSVGGNGLADVVEAGVDSGSVNYNGGNVLDSDNDGTPDYRDLDSDNDGINDVIENGGSDEDADGSIGSGNPVVNSDGVAAGATAETVDGDADGTPDFQDDDAGADHTATQESGDSGSSDSSIHTGLQGVGGCSVAVGAPFDPTLPLLVLLSMLALNRKKIAVVARGEG